MANHTHPQSDSISRRRFLGVAGAGIGGLLIGGAAGMGIEARGAKARTAKAVAAATRFSVPPGKWDEYYGFWSGGQSGELRILGIPSMREIIRIPVFNYDALRGWGIDDASREMLYKGGGSTVGDLHHPYMSYTDGEYDGRYIFVNDKENGRIARVRLDYFICDAITPIPNVQAVHGLFPQMYPKTGYVFVGSEFRTPLPNDGRNLNPTLDPQHWPKYGSLFTAVDGETMEVKWQVLQSGQNDLVAADYQGRYAMANCYNSEDAMALPGMTQADEDWTVFFHVKRIEEAIARGDYFHIGDSPVPVVDGRKENPRNAPGSPTALTYYVPVPKNPHGLDIVPPSYGGNYVIANGKLSPTCTVIDLDKVFVETDPRKCIVAQPELGLGPLHSTFDGRGHVYTTLFIDSQIVKWDLRKAIDEYARGNASPTAPVIQKLDVQYQPGHNTSSHGYTKHPRGDYLVSLNKFSKDRFLPVGPLHPDNDQLIDISPGHPMRLIKDTPVNQEPHFATICHKSVVLPRIQNNELFHPQDFPNRVKPGEQGVRRIGPQEVELRITGQAPTITPYFVEVQQGDVVHVIYTNLDGVQNLTHGFAVTQYNINMNIDPGETKEVTFVANKPGVFWYYCTWFCHALHLEMRGRLLVHPRAGVQIPERPFDLTITPPPSQLKRDGKPARLNRQIWPELPPGVPPGAVE
ncbi:MAG: TAT-dependent nitrous-oxide reductase [Firmicutes bacterium]|nr:TAT-dependent nitrous-oxide reductase [Bacillota bacterium]